MLSLSQLGEILLLIFFRGEEKNFLSPGIMRSAKTRRAFCTVASAALLATSSQTGVVGEPTTSSSFSSVSDESSLCDESAVASKDPFEKLSRRCSVDVEYGVGPLSIISDGASTNSGADTFVDNSEASSSIAKEEEEEEDKEYTFPATIRRRNNKLEEDKSFQVTYVFAYGQGIADGRVDDRAVLINPGGANGMPARAVNRMLFRGVAGDGGTYEFGFLGSAMFEEGALSNNNSTKRAGNLVSLAYNGQWCDRVSSETTACGETSYSWCCGQFLSPPPPPPRILIEPIGGNGVNSPSDDGNVTSMSGPTEAFDTFEHSSPSVFDASFQNSKVVPLSPLAQALDRGARMPKSSKLPSNIGTFGSISGLIVIGLVLIAIITEISRRCMKRLAKDLESCAPEISRKLTHLLPGQTDVSVDIDLEGIIVSKAHHHHHTNVSETVTVHALRRPQSRHTSIFENDGTMTMEFECDVASSRKRLDCNKDEGAGGDEGTSSSSELMDLKYASQSIETYNSINGYVQSLARMFDTGLFASQGRDRDGESAGKEKKGWRAHELRKNEFKITLADVKIGRAIGRGAYGVVCEGTYKGFPVAVKTLHAGKSTLSLKEKTAFECEISLLSRLSHVNIVTFYGACTDDKDHQLCVVMELMSKSLFQVLHENDRENRKNRRLTRLEFLRVASDVAAGCAYLHELKITHGDLKSHNVLLNGSGAKICDVGCARVAQITGMVTTQQSIALLQNTKGTNDPKEHNNNNNNKNVVGTPAYMAPELFDRSLDTNPTTTFGIDVYALAILSWECLSGETPWSHVQHPVQIAFAVCNDERLDCEKVGDWEEAKLLIQKCWKRTPKDRPSMCEIARTLKDMRTKVR